MTSTELRVLYVEDDPALRGILSVLLSARPDIEIVAAVGTSAEALASARERPPDVALLDVALNDGDISGLELGMTLRQIHPDIGIVILSQHQVAGFLDRLTPEQRHGWSFVLKKADLHPGYLGSVLQATARGLNVMDPGMERHSVSDAASQVERLTARQRSIMSIAAQGFDATAIAEQLGLTAGTVRQDLSQVYRVLVPDPPAGADLRTLAVLRYLEAMRTWTEPTP